MERCLTNVLVLAYLSAGCGVTYQVGGPSADISLDEAEERLVGKEARIFTGTRFSEYGRDGTVQSLTADKLECTYVGADMVFSTPTSSLRRIAVSPSTGIYVIGGFGGAVIGCLAGVAAVAVFAGDESDFNGQCGYKK